MLLAKSISTIRGAYPLSEHLSDTESAALALFSDARLGQQWARFWQVDLKTFLLHVRLAALAHDLGKANSGFQQAVQQLGEQSLRHEHLSALLLFANLANLGDKIDWDIVLAAVVGHHCKATDQQGKYLFAQNQSGIKPTLQIDDSLDLIWMRICQLAEAPIAPCPRPSFEQLETLRSQVIARADDFAFDLDDQPERRQLNAAVRTAVICSDAVASASFRTGRKISDWLAASIHRETLTPADIQSLIDDRYPQTPPYDWQTAIAQGSDRQAVVIGCGGGKSRAAWEWARERLRHWDLGRVLFLYPTQGTALEGFKDYAKAAGPAEALLVSGVAALDLETIASNPDEPDFRSDQALFALGAWDRRIFTGTVDQFLGAWEFQYSPLCHLPLLADAALILDEVHAYDERMWARVKSLLRQTHGPVLLLSATLQPHRLEDLQDLKVHVYGGGGSSAHPTYRFRLVDEREAKMVAANHSGRLLLVSNTVDRCQARGRDYGADVVYHSRFRRCDRAVQHEATLRTLRDRGVVSATQVCEMSLDVSASLMVTDLCDIPGLIQRAGRVNRYGEYPVAEILVEVPSQALPYAQADLDATLRLVQSIEGQTVDQTELALQLERFLPRRRSAEQLGQLFESGYWALAQDFRETDDYAVQGLLDCDIEQAITLVSDRKTAHRLQNLLCPAPAWWARRQRAPRGKDVHALLPPWIWVIPAASYSKKQGLQTSR